MMPTTNFGWGFVEFLFLWALNDVSETKISIKICSFLSIFRKFLELQIYGNPASLREIEINNLLKLEGLIYFLACISG